MECDGQKVHLAIHARSGICIARMQIGTNQVCTSPLHCLRFLWLYLVKYFISRTRGKVSHEFLPARVSFFRPTNVALTWPKRGRGREVQDPPLYHDWNGISLKMRVSPDHLMFLGDTTGGDDRDRVTRQPTDADIPCLLPFVGSERASLGRTVPEKAVGRSV